MSHPGEQFYPQGVHWDDPIAQGTLPELLSEAAREFSTRPAIEFRDRPISYAELQAMVEVAATAYLRAGYGRNTSVALFLGNTPDHPTNFFGALKAGARIVHLSPLDGELALSHKLSDSGARVLVTSNLSALLPTALKFLGQGLLDRLIVCEDDRWGKVGTPQAVIPNSPAIVTFTQFIDGATKPAQWPKISAADVALLQYTGGTTGLPKGAMLSHGNLTSARSVGAGQLRIGRRAAAGRGRQNLRAQGRHEAQERLGHDRDLLARHRPSQGRARQAGLDRTDAAGYRDGRGVAR